MNKLTPHELFTLQLRDNVIKCYGKEPETLDEVAEAIIAIINNVDVRRLATHKSNVPKSPKVLGFAWDINYDRKVSNTHCAPRTGVTNWGSNPDGPRGYPGFSGRVWIRYENDKNFSFGSDPFRETMSHPGTGGFGSYDGLWAQIASAHWKTYGHRRNPAHPRPELYSWDYKIFLDDWPALKAVINKETNDMEVRNTYNILANKPREVFKLSHSFKWNDPDTVVADEEFLKNFYATYEGTK